MTIDHRPADRRHRRHLRGHLPLAHRGRRLHQRGTRRLQVAGGRGGVLGGAAGDEGRDRPVVPGPGPQPVPRPLRRHSAGGSPPRTTRERILAKLNVAGNPPGLDGRPGALAQGRRHRCRPRARSFLFGVLLGKGARFTAGVRRHRRGGRLLRPRTCTCTRRATTARKDAACAAGRARPADHLRRGRPRLRLGPLPGRPQHRRAAGQRVRPGPAGDADRPGPVARAARDGRAQQPAGPAQLHLRDGAGRRLRHPGRQGAACAVQPRSGSSVANAPRSRPRRSRSRSWSRWCSSSCRALFVAVLGPAIISMMGAFGSGGALN